MSVEELKALERRFYDGINKMNLTACFELVANDFDFVPRQGRPDIREL